MPDERPSPAPSAGPPHPDRPLVASGIAIVVLLACVLVGAAVVRDGGGDAEASPPPETTTTVAAPDGPGEDLTLVDAFDGSDTFDGEGPLTEVEGLGPWTEARGTWRQEGGRATVTGGSEGGLNLATVDVGTPDVRAQVTLRDPDAGAALAFRVTDEDDYWLWAVVPGYATVVAYQVIDGVAHDRGNSGLTSLGSQVTLGVSAVGPLVELLVNGAVVLTLRDPGAAGDALGLGTAVDIQDASFEQVTVRRLG